MPRKASSAHDELARLRSVAAGERGKARDVEASLERHEEIVERSREQVVEAIASDDAKAVATAREAGEKASALVSELHEQVDAAGLRVLRAQHQVDDFARENADQLLDELVLEAEEIATNLNSSVADVLGLHRRLLDARQSMDRVISGAGGEPRSDGAEASHRWEAALGELAKAVQRNPVLAPPRPRWHGRAAQQERDRIHRALQAQRA